MLYMFGIGFIVDKYRKSPKVNISIDDRLLDSFEVVGEGTSNIPFISSSHWLPYDEDTYTVDPVEIQKMKRFINETNIPAIEEMILKLDGRSRKKFYDFICKRDKNVNGFKRKLCQSNKIKNWLEYQRIESVIPKNYKIYTIEEEILKDKKEIIIEVDNDDSNYTNGFMTRSTTVDLRNIFLLPVALLKLFRFKKEKFWKSMKEIIPREFAGVGDVNHNDFSYPAYPYPVTPKWNNSNMSVSRVGGSGKLNIKLNRYGRLIMFDQSEATTGHTREGSDNYVSKHIKKWLTDRLGKDDTEEQLEYHGLTKDDARSMLEQNKRVPAFIFSRLFISLVNHGFFDKYIE